MERIYKPTRRIGWDGMGWDEKEEFFNNCRYDTQADWITEFEYPA